MPTPATMRQRVWLSGPFPRKRAAAGTIRAETDTRRVSCQMSQSPSGDASSRRRDAAPEAADQVGRGQQQDHTERRRQASAGEAGGARATRRPW